MLFDKFRHFITRLTQSHTRTIADYRADTESVFSAFEFDPMWHGDHWQNLLSSPMDARRYVMEDWSVSNAPDWTEVNAPAPAH